MNPRFAYELAFDRNIGWVTPTEQQVLRGKRVAIAGMGGVGGVHLLTLARLGVGRFHIADFDVFDVANFNRQVGASMSTLGRPKVDVLAEMVLDINPESQITRFARAIDRHNIGDFLRDVDLYVDGLDFFAFDARELVFEACAERGIPAITVAPAGMGAALVNFVPGSMTFEEYFGLRGRPDAERALRFAIGLAPAGLHRPYLVVPERIDLPGRKFPSTIMGCQVSAGVAATEALKLLFGRGEVVAAPRAVHFDAFRNRLVRTWRPGGHRHPMQRLALALGRRMVAAASSAAPVAGGRSPTDDIERVVSAGVCAPSADNRHQFRIRRLDGALELVATDEFLGTTERHRRVLTLFSYGAVIENMVLEASRLGLAAPVTWRPAEQPGQVLARIGPLVPQSEPGDELARAIALRTTNRRMYRPPGPTSTQRDQLAREVASAGAAQLHWLDGQARRSLLSIVWLAESERFRRQRLHEELFGAIRFDAGWKASTTDALPPVALEVEPPMRPMFQAMRHWRLMQLLHLTGAHRVLGLRAGWLPCWQAPALGVVSAASLDDASVVEAGRGFQRLWLRATLLGLAMQPLAAAAVLALQSDADQGISSRARDKLQETWRSLLPGRAPLIVFRIGHADAPSGRTGRPAWMQFLDEG